MLTRTLFLAAAACALLQAETLAEIARAAPVSKLVRKQVVLQPPSAGWGVEMVSSAAMDRNGVLHLLQRGKNADPVIAIDAYGKVLRSWGKGLFTIPHSIRFDPEGNVWTVDAGSSTVLKFTPSGEKLLEIHIEMPGPERCNELRGKSASAPSTGFCGATDITFAPGGRIFVSDGYANDRILEFNSKGRMVRQFGKPGKGNGEFQLPHGIAADDKGNLFVADRESGRIQRFDLEGRYLGEWNNLGKTFSLTWAYGRLWAGTQPLDQPNGSPGWIFELDPGSGSILSALPSEGGNHFTEVTKDGQVFCGPVKPSFLWYARR